MKAQFTEQYIHRLSAREREYAVWDAVVPGLGLRVAPGGRKTFILQTRLLGKQRKLVLGHYPAMSVKEARAAFLARRELILNGPETGLANPSVPRFDTFANGVWTARTLSRWKPESRRTGLSYLRSRLLPAFGRLYLDEIDRAAVAGWFDAYSKTYPGGANRALSILSSILDFAIIEGHMEGNPARGIAMNPKKVLNRFLSAEEIKRVSQELRKAARESPDYNRVRTSSACCC